jgi:hypothetical protein
MRFKELYYLQENSNPLIDNIISTGKVPTTQPTYIEFNKEPYRSLIVNICEVIPNNTWAFTLKSLEAQNKYTCTYIKDSSNLSAKLEVQHIPLYKHTLSESELNYVELKNIYGLSEELITTIHKSVKDNFKTLIILDYKIYKDNLQDDVNIKHSKTKLIVFNNIKNIDINKLANIVSEFHALLMSQLDLQPNIELKAKESGV